MLQKRLALFTISYSQTFAYYIITFVNELASIFNFISTGFGEISHTKYF